MARKQKAMTCQPK